MIQHHPKNIIKTAGAWPNEKRTYHDRKNVENRTEKLNIIARSLRGRPKRKIKADIEKKEIDEIFAFG